MIELTVPEIGESITEVLIASWLVEEGQSIGRDEPVAELESDKATIELPAPVAGVIQKLLVAAGTTVPIGAVIAQIDPASATTAAPEPEAAIPAISPDPPMTPSARRVLAEQGITPQTVTGSGKGGIILKEDALKAAAPAVPVAPVPTATTPLMHTPAETSALEEVVPLSPIRRTIARRLLESQQTTAQLTTFQEVDMAAVIELRSRYKAAYIEHHGVKLGFMSFFVKATIEALKAFPSVNAEIRGDTVAYKNYYNIGIAVGGGKGLVVPVLKSAEQLSFAEIERSIADFGQRGAANKITLAELTGGTFSISNGGIYGSLLGTPILNPPQSGILGLHAIQDRAVVINGEIRVRPMMYLALTYDHRIVDGRESVGFLLKIKDVIEDPARLFLEI